MVAWHEVPGNRPVKIRPEGYGMILSPLSRSQARTLTKQASIRKLPLHTVPYGTDSRPRDSRHFVPGYHHLVPPGQNRFALGFFNSLLGYHEPQLVAARPLARKTGTNRLSIPTATFEE